MSLLNPFGVGVRSRDTPEPQRSEYLLLQRPLHRVLAFTGRSIDDIVNDPIARNQVLGYYKLHKQIERKCEVAELERWWNPLG